MQINAFSPCFHKHFTWILTTSFSLGLALIFMGCTNKEQIRTSAFNYFQEGNKAYEARDFQSAVWNYIHAINLDDQTADFHYNLGLAYFATGKYPEALDSFSIVQEMRPNMADTYYNMALIYNKLYKQDLADKYYNRYQLIIKTESNRASALGEQGLPQSSNPAMQAHQGLGMGAPQQQGRPPQQAGQQRLQAPQQRPSPRVNRSPQQVRGPQQARQQASPRQRPQQARQQASPRQRPQQAKSRQQVLPGAGPRGGRPGPTANQPKSKAPVLPGLPAWENVR